MVADLASLLNATHTKRLVVKIGSALLVEDGAPRAAWLASLIADIVEARRRGSEIIIVSSGAIALGAARLGLKRGGRASLADAQAAASVGQVALAQLWAEALARHDLTAAQMLVTLGDLEDRRRYLNASATLDRLIATGAVPVVNENDSVATEEIRFGDNDRLAARVAQAANASGVLLLSDVAGLYDRDPSDPDAVLIERVEGVTPEVIAMAGSDSGSGLGSGGMRAKLQAARIAERAGLTLGIIDGRCDHPLTALRQTGKGTVFVPLRRDTARKAWIGGRLAIEGVLSVDAGCARAIAAGGASLLAAGLTEVTGDFQRGALVGLHGPKGERLGQGLVEYAASECRAILGKRESEQEAELGYAPRAAVVHRDHMVQG
ncbi:MAG: glutamate 5-kinase [Pseudomonadota bacterium]